MLISQKHKYLQLKIWQNFYIHCSRLKMLLEVYNRYIFNSMLAFSDIFKNRGMGFVSVKKKRRWRHNWRHRFLWRHISRRITNFLKSLHGIVYMVFKHYHDKAEVSSPKTTACIFDDVIKTIWRHNFLTSRHRKFSSSQYISTYILNKTWNFQLERP